MVIRSKIIGLARIVPAALLAFIGIAPVLAQQYCVSGAVTSVVNCSSCTFKVGDPVAMTFTVKPGGAACTAGVSCRASASLDADIGTRHWTTQNDSNPNDATVAFTQLIVPTVNSVVSLGGVGTLSPLPSATAPERLLSVSLSLVGFPGSLIPNAQLPTGLPTPDAVATSGAAVQFDASLTSTETASFSYKGQTCATSSSAAPPSINTGGVVPLYSSATTIQPGSWVSIFGSNLASAAATWNGDFPILLGGTSVTIDGKAAYLWYISPGQINLQAADDTASGPVSVVVTTAAGSATSTVTLGQFGPSFNLLDGKHVAGIILRSDGSGAFGGGTYDILGPTGTSLGYKTVAAKAGDVLELFGVGFGPTNPTVQAGKAYSGAAATTNPVSLSINNITVTPSFSGLTSAGLYQINVTLPAALGTGDVSLRAIVGGVQTPAGVMLSLQ